MDRRETNLRAVKEITPVKSITFGVESGMCKWSVGKDLKTNCFYLYTGRMVFEESTISYMVVR